jgi:uncharacterized protein
MSDVFIYIYRFFRKRKAVFYLFLAATSLAIVFSASRIRLGEDITQSLSSLDQSSKYEYVIRNFKFADKLVVHFSLKDTNAGANPDLMVSVAGNIRDSLLAKLDSNYIKQVFLQFNDSLFQAAQDIINLHLPLFLDEPDYKTIDSLVQPSRIEGLLQSNYRILVSPASMLMKQRIAGDPLGITGLALKKLNSLKSDDQYLVYDGCIFSLDKKHLLMFITPANPSSETNKNTVLISGLDKVVASINSNPGTKVKAEYFGYAATSVGNAGQIKKDLVLTLVIAIVFIFLLTGWYFRSIMVPLLGFVPAFFGGGLALAVLYAVKGNVSFIALGIGSVILGLIIDYALYMVNHFRKKKSVEQVIRDMSQTIIICCLTSVGAFLCLIFLKSAVLHDLGWFAAISVFGASMCALIILPQFLGKGILPAGLEPARDSFIGKIAAIDYGKKKWLLAGLGIAGILSLFVTNKVTFEKDLNTLNYMSEPLKNAERSLEMISSGKLKKVYIVSTGKNLNEALILNEATRKKLEELKKQGKIHDFSGINTLLLSDSIQHERIRTWNKFWTPERKTLLIKRFESEGKKIGFNENAFSGLRAMLYTDFSPIPAGQSDALREALFSDWINETHDMTMVSGIAMVRDGEKQFVYKAFAKDQDVVVFDRQNLTTRFVMNVKHDFELLVTLSMIFVTLLLLVSFGRIELAFISSLPMFLSWLITLGFMWITGIRFNIFNIIISSFIFGLGVDYSILMMRGLLNRYKTGNDDIKTYQVSILLSSATTLIGVSALFFAVHPALRSIALISVVGVISVVIISLSFQSALTHWLLTEPLQKKKYPLTARIVFRALFISWIPISLNALLLVIYGSLVNPLLPFPRKLKQTIFHRFFAFLSRQYIRLNFPFHHSVEKDEEDAFSKPAVIICNHQSLIDTPALLRLHPKIIILTSDWVFHNWVFGPVARVAGFIPVADNIDDSLSLIKQRVDEGFSILIFPEGHRSTDGQIQRFHKGAFYIAEKLKIDIQPVLMFGGGDFLPKGIFWGKSSRLFTKILPRILPGDHRFGLNYSERAKQVRRYYRKEYESFKARHNTPDYNALTLRLHYLYKGPVLEWYLRVKMILENNFTLYCSLLPAKGEILDLGCGYGYISYMLMLTSDKRKITGVDHDEMKIAVAENGYLKNDRISFFTADVAEYPVTPMDGFLLGDVLHYLPYDRQEALLETCIRNLRPGGVILVRDGNADQSERHQRTKFTELFSTKIFRFNKTIDDSGNLFFTSGQKLQYIAEQHGLTFEIIDRKRVTSNNFFVLRLPLKNNSINS